MKNYAKLFCLVLIVAFCNGCANRNNTMYCLSSDYTNALYLYLQGEPNYDEQLQLMQDYFEEAKSTNTLPAPGSYAQMALIYSKIGNDNEAKRYLDLEKEKYPESGHYIDFINAKKNK